MADAGVTQHRPTRSPAGGVPHEAHEGLALVLRELREESNQVPEIGGHPQWSGLWSGVFLDCGFSRRFLVHSTPRGGTTTAVSFANASGGAGSLSWCESVGLSACTACVGFCAAFWAAALAAESRPEKRFSAQDILNRYVRHRLGLTVPRLVRSCPARASASVPAMPARGQGYLSPGGKNLETGDRRLGSHTKEAETLGVFPGAGRACVRCICHPRPSHAFSVPARPVPWCVDRGCGL